MKIATTLLQTIREANKSYLNGSTKYLDPGGPPFAVVACIDARLTALLEPALGLSRNRALVTRIAGNHISPNSTDVQRSIAVAVYLKGCTEILIVGHTDCAMAAFSTSDVIERFRALGVPRSAFGQEDLRSWFGAFSNVRDNVLESAAQLRKSEILPNDIKIHCLIMDIETGEVEVVREEGAGASEIDVSRADGTPGQPEQESEKPEVAVISESSLGVSEPPKLPGIPGQESEPDLDHADVDVGTVKPPAPDSMLDATLALRELFMEARQNPEVQRAVTDLRGLLRGETHPSTFLPVLEKIVLDHGGRHPNLPKAMQFIRSALGRRADSGSHFVELLRRVLD
jgi:carbonic anhydrase